MLKSRAIRVFLIVLMSAVGTLVAVAVSGYLYFKPNLDSLAKEVVAFEAYESKNTAPTAAVLFVGSSSIRYWKTQEAFPDLTIINRGFGGSTATDLLHFYDRLVGNKQGLTDIILYEGDNDIAGGMKPEDVKATLDQLIGRMHEDFPEARIFYLTIKPSVLRWEMWPEMAAVNEMLKLEAEKLSYLYYVDMATPLLDEAGKPNPALFAFDGLHLNEKGYAAWNKQFLAHF